MAKFRLTREVSIQTAHEIRIVFPKGFVFESKDSFPRQSPIVAEPLHVAYGTLRPVFVSYEYEVVSRPPLYLTERKVVALPVVK